MAQGAPTATQATVAAYTAGGVMSVTNTLSYSGQLWSLLWRPHLPNAWVVTSVSGTGNPELEAGDIVWTGTLPASPIQMIYWVQVPAGARGSYSVRGEVEYQLSGMVNPANLYASPDPLSISNSPMVLTVTGLSAVNKVYDRTTVATLTGAATLSGVVPGDVVNLGGTATGSFADKTVGTNKLVTVSGLALTGADAGNYTLSAPNLSANITAATANVTGLTAGNKVYDGTTAATLSGTASLTNVVAGDVEPERDGGGELCRQDGGNQQGGHRERAVADRGGRRQLHAGPAQPERQHHHDDGERDGVDGGQQGV